MDNFEIIEFEEKYHEDLKRLSYEWLIKYDLLEPEDEKFINHPWEEVLNDGGHIFLARLKDDIIGTISLMKLDEFTREIVKFCVSDKYQGRKIGQKLLQKCIDTSKDEGAKKIILFSNHQLNAAFMLYKKLGFKEIPMDHSRFTVADRKMEMEL